MVYRCVVSIESRRKISAAQCAYWLHAYRLNDRIIHTRLLQFIILLLVVLVAGCSMSNLNPLLELLLLFIIFRIILEF